MPSARTAFLTKPTHKLGDSVILATLFAEALKLEPDLQLFCLGGETLTWANPLLNGQVQVINDHAQLPKRLDTLIHFRAPTLESVRLAKASRTALFITEDRGLLKGFATRRVRRNLPRTTHQVNIWGEYFRLAFPNFPNITEYLDYRPLVKSTPETSSSVVINTHTSGSNRPPSAHVFSEIIEICRAHGLGIKLLSGRGCNVAESLQKNHPAAQIIRPSGIQQLADLLASAALVITPDTGPAHLAAALRVPVIDLYCKALLPSERWTPLAPKVALIRPDRGCPSCLARNRCHHGKYPDDTCTESFDLDQISTVIRDILAK